MVIAVVSHIAVVEGCIGSSGTPSGWLLGDAELCSAISPATAALTIHVVRSGSEDRPRRVGAHGTLIVLVTDVLVAPAR
jgi:hypothetical protein